MAGQEKSPNAPRATSHREKNANSRRTRSPKDESERRASRDCLQRSDDTSRSMRTRTELGVVLSTLSLVASPFLYAIHAKPEAVGKNGRAGVANAPLSGE